MPLKKSVGQMYSWVTNMHTHLGGECSHKCIYCYVGKNRFGRADRYKGEPRLIKEELLVDYYKYGKGKTIFIEHMNDLFVESVDTQWIYDILAHCNQYPDNKYVFQTKNPKRILDFVDYLPNDVIIGTTIETNRDLSSISKAPPTYKRVEAMIKLKEYATREEM